MSKRKIIILSICLTVLSAGGCVAASWRRNLMATDQGIVATLNAVRSGLPRARLFSQRLNASAVDEYAAYYGLDVGNSVAGAMHSLASIDVDGYTVAVNLFRIQPSSGTVLIAHGYFDHSGVWSRVIEELVRNGYSVCVYDQPGHGLSTGARADIGDFSEYTRVFARLVEECKKHMPGPLHVVSHSMGCAIVADYLLTDGKDDFGNVVMMAPLVRPVLWRTSRWGVWAFGRIMPKVPRKFRNNSSDKEFLEFTRRDPLQPRTVPLGWVQALCDWYERTMSRTPLDRAVAVIQGNKDTTVDWQYGIQFVRKKFLRTKVFSIPNAR